MNAIVSGYDSDEDETTEPGAAPKAKAKAKAAPQASPAESSEQPKKKIRTPLPSAANLLSSVPSRFLEEGAADNAPMDEDTEERLPPEFFKKDFRAMPPPAPHTLMPATSAPRAKARTSAPGEKRSYGEMAGGSGKEEKKKPGGMFVPPQVASGRKNVVTEDVRELFDRQRKSEGSGGSSKAKD
ncbi:unnamed protein product [Vitrella brassicaformis CCMP3155]|uniref:Uncharacterized protein n=2 Tax=Vitrella brassicaformis TaxID=1169539 RepID=A0A0G4EWU3_VITBC|nr:unnamed protein product [Vitrella brassicaformis CCMP3155]|eukprot:CEM02544.1 unnamed protein product [Vitrella brassicaformis CCMP3155]